MKNPRFRNVKEVVQGPELDDEDAPGVWIPVCFSFYETLLQKGEPEWAEKLGWVRVACDLDSEEFGPSKANLLGPGDWPRNRCDKETAVTGVCGMWEGVAFGLGCIPRPLEDYIQIQVLKKSYVNIKIITQFSAFIHQCVYLRVDSIGCI